MATSYCMNEAIWLRQLLADMGFVQLEPTPLKVECNKGRKALEGESTSKLVRRRMHETHFR